jgi:Ca-activated chloride channel homolog
MSRKIIVLIIFCCVLLTVALTPGKVTADGIIIIEPTPCPLGLDCFPEFPIPIRQLEIRYHHVDVEITNQIATTHVDQVFYNPATTEVEGTYIFPLPTDATVTDFRLWIDGEPVSGKVLDADSARAKYEEIVRTMRDPALLEYAGQGAYQASVYPIPAKSERRIELEYQQVLTAENELVKYSYPLSTEKFSLREIDSVSVTVSIRATTPIRAVYSPSHPISVARNDMNQVTASYEDEYVLPDQNFDLFYSLGETEAIHTFSYRDPENPEDSDGYFLMFLAPPVEPPDDVIAKDVLLVLDRSGSMEGEKFRQAQVALKMILNHLDEEDRFYVTAFSDNLKTYDNQLTSASEVDHAIAWVDRLSAAGSTDINRALLEAVSVVPEENDGELHRPTYLIFLTDGLPTAGVTDPEEILRNVANNAPDNMHLFSFGVGFDVDTYLLDSLTQANQGLSTYVNPGGALDEVLSGFYETISTPVLTDIEIQYGDLTPFGIYPDPLPDLFADNQVVIVGRYRYSGNKDEAIMTDVVLSGKVNNYDKEVAFLDQVFTGNSGANDEGSDWLPRLWATRKVGYLLSSIRLNGADEETIKQIVQLSIRYGIVTPYTSYLVTEPMPLGAANQQVLSEQVLRDYQGMPQAAASGQAAVEKAVGEGDMTQADQALPLSGNNINGQKVVQIVAQRVFVLSGGVWVDTTFDPDKMETQEVAFLSETYFELAKLQNDVGAGLALGNRVIIVIGGTAYEIVSEDTKIEDEVVLPPTEEAETAETASTIKEPTLGQDSIKVETQSGALVEELGAESMKRDPQPYGLLLMWLGIVLLGLGLAWVLWRTAE